MAIDEGMELMLGVTMLGLNASGWLKETNRSQREYFADTDRSVVQACINELRAVAAGKKAAAAC